MLDDARDRGSDPGLAQPVPNPSRQRSRSSSIGSEGQHSELVPSRACKDVARPARVEQDVGHPMQQTVAGGVTVRVIDRFEEVQI